MKMALKTVKRSTVKTRSKRKRKGSSAKRRPKKKNQKGGFIFTPYFKAMNNIIDYGQRKGKAKKRGKKFRKEKATDHFWEFVEEKLG